MTASLPQSRHDYTFADYLALERESEIKHEFDAGEILAMPGGTARHSALAVNVTVALSSTRTAGCTVFQSDMRVANDYGDDKATFTPRTLFRGTTRGAN